MAGTQRPLAEHWNGWPNAEGFRAFHARVTAALSDVLGRHGWRPQHEHDFTVWHPGATQPNLAIVAHGGTNAVSLAHLLDLDPLPGSGCARERAGRVLGGQSRPLGPAAHVWSSRFNEVEPPQRASLTSPPYERGLADTRQRQVPRVRPAPAAPSTWLGARRTSSLKVPDPRWTRSQALLPKRHVLRDSPSALCPSARRFADRKALVAIIAGRAVAGARAFPDAAARPAPLASSGPRDRTIRRTSRWGNAARAREEDAQPRELALLSACRRARAETPVRRLELA